MPPAVVSEILRANLEMDLIQFLSEERRAIAERLEAEKKEPDKRKPDYGIGHAMATLFVHYGMLPEQFLGLTIPQQNAIYEVIQEEGQRTAGANAGTEAAAWRASAGTGAGAGRGRR